MGYSVKAAHFLAFIFLCSTYGDVLSQKIGVLPYRPKDGDKLGYSKEESVERLTPEMRKILDGVLRIYREPGLLAKKDEAFYSIEAVPGRREQLDSSAADSSAREPFRQYALPTGFFSRQGRSVVYSYRGRSGRDAAWRVSMEISISRSEECVDSRAVEGYLDLYLYANIDGTAHLMSPDLWDRHGLVGSPFAKAALATTPDVRLDFVRGCLVFILFAKSFDQKELSDDSIFN